MSVTGNSVFPLPESAAADLCRNMGQVLGNAAMYGMAHTVTVNAQNVAYEMLVGLLDLYGGIEWGLFEDGLLINGTPVDTGRGTAQVLIDQLRRGGINNFAVCPPLDRREFTTFLSILSAEPTSPLVADGVAAAVVKAGLKSIRIDKAVYERVGSQSAHKGTVAASGHPRHSGGRGEALAGEARGEKGRVFDLDSDLLAMDDAGLDGGGTSVPGALEITAQAANYLEQRNAIMRQHTAMVDMVRRCADDPSSLEDLRQQLLASGLSQSEWRLLLAEGGVGGGARRDDKTIARLLQSVEELADQRAASGTRSQSMTNALESISREVDSLIQHTHGHASSLAQRVDADRGTVAELEQRARDSGVGLQLSREDLLGSLAEINQELVQPLTTSSTMLQMLSDGKMGELNPEQRDVLKMATEGMDRLEKLITYLQRISGFPVELSPDHGLLSEVYGNKS
jgi:hypothetical protein